MHAKPIRALARGLEVLAALNLRGHATALALAQDTGTPRATVYRVLQTLMDAGYVGRGVGDERFHLRLKVHALAQGFADAQWITSVAAPALADLTARISWPCDVSTLDGLAMVVRDTTHGVAPLSIDRNMVGRELPLLGSASGMAYLAFAPPSERDTLLDLLATSDGAADLAARDPVSVKRALAATRRRGYGLRQGGPIWPHTGSVALPVRAGGRLLGCVTVVWMARVVDAEEGIGRCLDALRETRDAIERSLA